MSETKKIDQAEQEADASELSDLDLENAAGGTIGKPVGGIGLPTTGCTDPHCGINPPVNIPSF